MANNGLSATTFFNRFWPPIWASVARAGPIMCPTGPGASCRFFKMWAAANFSDQLLNMKRESEVMARSLENLTCLGMPRHPGHFFPKRIRSQMFSARSPTQDGKVRPWQAHVKIQYVKPRGGSGFRFFRNGCGDKNSGPSLGLNMEK